MSIIELLHEGKENAVSLDYLAAASGLNCRGVREEISRINTSGEEIICTDHEGRGYYIAANMDEAMAYRRYNMSYWKSGLEKDKGILRCMERKFSGQMDLGL